MKIFRKLLTGLVLPLVIIGLAYAIVQSVMTPVKFNEEREFREQVGVQRLKDIRTLQEAYKTETGRYSPTFDSLKIFYNTGELNVIMQIGSKDDSLAMVNTAALKKRNRRITPEQMLERYNNGEKLVFQIENKVLVKDTLFLKRPDFSIDSLAIIPFCGDSVMMETVVKMVSGVKVPLFEASMSYRSLLKGMDNQLRINLDDERKDTGRYPGLKVGSVSAPNNNAGNWE